jgi:glycolate oxidase iron-sulfur subunit
MQTGLADFIRNTPEGDAAEAVLRKCVHCGFCNATCPTYQLLGDELDGPRGRIYLMKQMFEGTVPAATVLPHLDRCPDLPQLRNHLSVGRALQRTG